MDTLFSLENFRLFEIQYIDVSDVFELILRFAFNIVILFVLIRYLYSKHTKKKEFIFSHFAIGITVFLLCFLLESVKIELGFALGLFAIFGIIRYRTDTIPIREMTYLFVVIGISIINALASKKISYAELLITNAGIIALLYMLEKKLLLKKESSKEIVYDKFDNIHKDNEHILIQELQAITGIPITRISIKKYDIQKQSATIIMYYYSNRNVENS